MTAALSLADQGFIVHLVEKEAELGGYLKEVHYLLNGEDPREALRRLIPSVTTHRNVRVYANSTLTEVKGSLGNFDSKIAVAGNGTMVEVRHGVVIVATGAQTYKPVEYLYGEDHRVLLHRELEQQLAANRFAPKNSELKAKSVAFIQCVGSRTPERPYCSRTCCSETIKLALRIKESQPDTHVYVLYRELRAYGFREAYYTKARQLGVAFIRFADDRPPTVVGQNGKLLLSVRDETLGESLQLLVDNIVLAAATVPSEGNKELAQLLKVPLGEDKFFLEAHRKLRPIDFATDGIFLCGNAHSPLDVEEVISQALGAEPTISNVVTDNCDGCAYCVDPCPFKAITLVEYEVGGVIKKRVEVNQAICKGCGTCMATCPKKAIFVWHFRPEQLQAEVKAALEDLEKNWGTHAVAVNALLEKQAKKLKAEFAEILKPIQAQIAPVVAATAETAQAQFNAALLAQHADAFTIIPDVEKWIESQPAYLQSAYNKVLDEGSAADVAKFLTDYKASTSKQAPADDSAAKAAAEKAEAERLAKLDKMKQPATTRTSVTAEPDPQDFDAAFEAGAKLAAQLAA